MLFREVTTFQNSSDQKLILILRHGARYTISLYVLYTHPNYTALTIQFKESRKICTGKNVYFGVHCFCMVWYKLVTRSIVSVYYYNGTSKKGENSPQIPDPEMS